MPQLARKEFFLKKEEKTWDVSSKPTNLKAIAQIVRKKRYTNLEEEKNDLVNHLKSCNVSFVFALLFFFLKKIWMG